MLLRIYYICYNQVRNVRTVSRKGTVFRKALVSNPGIENRVKILQLESPNDENLDVNDLNLDDLESDFMEAGNLHREYEREKIRASRKLSYAITKRKYFKPPKLPNLLMWSEKEQVRHLHQLDPSEWDAEKLSRCFPAPLQVITKILKSKWKPKDKNAMERHDIAVQRNWIALKEGKFNIEEDLKQHLLSFSSRRLVFPSEDLSENGKQIIIHNQPRRSSEFSDIVNNKTSCRSLYDDENIFKKENHIEVDIPEFFQKKVHSKTCDPKSDSYVMPGKTPEKQELMSYKEFKKELIKSVSECAEKDDLSMKYYDYLNEDNCKEDVQSLPHQENLPEIKGVSKRENELTKYKKEEIDNNLTPHQLDVFMKAESYKNKIRIPKEKRDSSAIYKVKDCFYDMDGKFLYRVPGLK